MNILCICEKHVRYRILTPVKRIVQSHHCDRYSVFFIVLADIFVTIYIVDGIELLSMTS